MHQGGNNPRAINLQNIHEQKDPRSSNPSAPNAQQTVNLRTPNNIPLQNNVTTVTSKTVKNLPTDDKTKMTTGETLTTRTTLLRPQTEFQVPQFTFNLDKMIANLANDSDKEIAGIFTSTTTTTTVAPPRPPNININGLEDLQNIIPNIFNSKTGGITFSIPAQYLAINNPVQLQTQKTIPPAQVVKHEISNDGPTIASTESLMDARIKKLPKPKPIELSFKKNPPGKHLLRATLPEYPLEAEDTRPLHVNRRAASTTCSELEDKQQETKNKHRRVFQAKLIIEELTPEDECAENEDGGVLFADNRKRQNPKVNAGTSQFTITTASTATHSTNGYKHAAAPKYKKIIKKYILKIPVLKTTQSKGPAKKISFKRTTPLRKEKHFSESHRITPVRPEKKLKRKHLGHVHSTSRPFTSVTPPMRTIAKSTRLHTAKPRNARNKIKTSGINAQ